MINNSRLIQEADERLPALLTWAEQGLSARVENWEVLAGDASTRRYLRLWTCAGSWIAMLAPPPENSKAFVAMAELLRSAGIRVPRIYGQDFRQGFLLLEDFGDITYFKAMRSGLSESLYEAALAALYRLQVQLDPESAGLLSYDEPLLRRELDIFRQWLAEGWLGLKIPTESWDSAVEVLVRSALEQPKVVVHRDYHSRNLMVLSDATPGVLDFQDAVVGPVTYDLVSLLRDCYLAWPSTWVRHQQEAYRRRLTRIGMDVPKDKWQLWFDRMGAQRHLKAAGIFARLWLRDGKPGYLQDIPRTLNYVVAVAQQDAALRGLGKFLQSQVLPKVKERLPPCAL
ncbi:MAG: aminoglycoside phosphotransferase family protein [Methylohalobius sp.]